MSFTGNWACNTFKTGMMNGTFNFTSGSFKIALYTNAATLDATTTAYTSTGEVVASGYTAGGLALTIAQVPTVGSSGTTAYISFNNAVWTSALTARGALIYQTTTGNPAVCVLDFGSDKTSNITFTVQFPSPSNTSAIIRIS
jgi:O-acetylhomoserine/O-acetylserine sulfhydrylase-like pyridoxal-dependent enzyme